MKEPVNYVEMNKSDFEFSDQLSGEAEATYIFGIYIERLFSKKMGGADRFSVPVVGAYFNNIDPTSRVKSYALYNVMSQNQGYDVVFYPQYEVTANAPIGIPIVVTYKVKVTTRLAKVKK
jgi:hypothetical protein